MILRTTWRGREVTAQPWRALIMLVAMVAALLGFIGAIIAFCMIPVMLILHPIFLLFGRTGTYRYDGSHLEICLDREAFRKR